MKVQTKVKSRKRLDLEKESTLPFPSKHTQPIFSLCVYLYIPLLYQKWLLSSTCTFILLALREHKARATPGLCSLWSKPGDREGPQADPGGSIAASGELPAGVVLGGLVPVGLAPIWHWRKKVS